jgi:hypothetical protein
MGQIWLPEADTNARIKRVYRELPSRVTPFGSVNVNKFEYTVERAGDCSTLWRLFGVSLVAMG